MRKARVPSRTNKTFLNRVPFIKLTMLLQSCLPWLTKNNINCPRASLQINKMRMNKCKVHILVYTADWLPKIVYWRQVKNCRRTQIPTSLILRKIYPLYQNFRLSVTVLIFIKTIKWFQFKSYKYKFIKHYFTHREFYYLELC